MKIVVFGLSISSTWGNGHATLWRGLCKALARAGHQVVFFERSTPYYAANRDLFDWESGRLVLYQGWSDICSTAKCEIGEADAAIITSYCPDSIAATELLAESSRALRVFYDLDTPVTLSRLAANEPVAYIGDRRLQDFDLVLSFTGGRALELLTSELGAKRVAALYGSVDPECHYRAERHPNYICDLSYLGTYSEDRQAILQALIISPAELLPEKRFLLGGAQYPDHFPWRRNIGFVRHLPCAEHPSFFSSCGMTLNVTRRAMSELGWCPSGRLFEAAACGAPIISDRWDGLEEFFGPGEEILLADTTSDVIAALELGEGERAKLAARARQRALDEHSASRRAGEMIAHFERVGHGEQTLMEA